MLIRKKILYSTLLLTLTLLLLGYCSLRGVYAYRSLTINIGTLSTEFARIENLRRNFDALRDILVFPAGSEMSISRPAPRSFQVDYVNFLGTLATVKDQFANHEERIRFWLDSSDPLLRTSESELKRVKNIRESLDRIEAVVCDLGAKDPSLIVSVLLSDLRLDIGELLNYRTSRMDRLRQEMRSRYRSWFAVIIASAVASLINVGITFWFFRQSIVKPFKLLLSGSKSIADGEFDHRIQLHSKDELSDLADAMNSMTDRFVQVKDNLNEQVQERTQEVVRSEQLASVGFLAAGVAHEINNPLASIAWSAEALESRLHEVLHVCEPKLKSETDDKESHGFDPDQIEVLRTYLRRIQDEAFRCKGITERLLDFSRLGESSQKQETDIHSAVTDVCELVKHLGQYRNRGVHFAGTPGIHAWVSPTEFKQVVLNLLTNALDASNDGDQIEVYLEASQSSFTLKVVDQGCGMTDEVIKHLFEPFYTRRRDGRGTGLGLSITYRIVQDHGGTLVPTSAGPNMGSTMKLTIPINQSYVDSHERLQAA